MIGREKEKQELLDLLEKEESQFVAVYGRRRVGKTYLIKETFGSNFSFQYTGIINANKRQQLETFYTELVRQGLNETKIPKNWFEAFDLLRSLLEKKKNAGKRKIVFIDELPWMDNPKSDFVSALGYFWNSWAGWTKDIVLVVCGSATSWIVKKIFKDRGGLHNRVTRRIYLRPFTLYECEQYCKSQKLNFNRIQLAELYMIFGGIPYYWSLLDRSLALTQNIDALCFAEGGELTQEFDRLYASLFRNPDEYLTVVKTLCGKKGGMSREEIIAKSKLKDNGKLSEILQNLEYCDFIRIYYPYGKKERGAIYQIIDNFTLFYYHFMASHSHDDPHLWSSICNSTKHSVWAGLAFERLCLQHVPQIKLALGISGIGVSTCSWQTNADNSAYNEGAQIDLLLVRADKIIEICEIKYAADLYHVTAKTAEKIRQVSGNFQNTTRTRHGLRNLLITTFGVYDNEHKWAFDNVVTLDQLFTLSE